jgi:hypothetical protein
MLAATQVGGQDGTLSDHMTIMLIGGPLDGATVPWDDANVDTAFPCATTYAWYRFAPIGVMRSIGR